MPVTDLSGDDDWLQQYLAGHQTGQAFGASQPYGPGGLPGPYSGGPQGLMPGGGLYGRTQTTPGAPSMGYPAMGQPTAQPPPAAAPGPAQGLSLTNNPIANWLRNNVSIGAPNLRNISPDFFHDMSAIGHMAGPWFGGASSTPAATATSPPAKRTDAAYGPYDDPNAPDPVGDYVSRVGNYPSWPTPPAGATSGGAPVSVATSPRGVKRTDAAYGPYDAPQGSPSQTPRPASSKPFIRIDRVNAGPLAQPQRGYQTALDLSQFFRRG